MEETGLASSSVKSWPAFCFAFSGPWVGPRGFDPRGAFLPGRLPALLPEDHARSLGTDFKEKLFAGAELLMGYTKANNEFRILLQGPWHRPTPKRTYPIAILCLTSRSVTHHVQGDVDQYEAAVDRRAARFRCLLLDPGNDCLP